MQTIVIDATATMTAVSFPKPLKMLRQLIISFFSSPKLYPKSLSISFMFGCFRSVFQV